MISFQFIDLKKPSFLRMNQLKSFLKVLVMDEGKHLGDLSVVMCTDEYLLKVNQDFLQHDYYTDIITFDYCDDDVVSGDLLISYERVLENSILEKTDEENEFYRVVFHGLLHLCGYKDKSEEDILLMRSKENEYLTKFVSRETNKD
jgi:rRNA maturation RNase YbeY